MLAWVRLYSAQIDTILIPSPSMGKSYPALIVLPDSHKNTTKKFPSLYLLHGHSGNFAGWYDIATQMKQWADLYQLVIICPDGDHDSWYLNSPVQKNRKFETYFAEEITGYIDSHYKTFNRPESRGISGVSMGGHGAMYLALKHPDVFGLVGSSSGGLDLLPFHNDWNLQVLLGPFPENMEVWKEYSCYYLLDKMNATNLKIWIDCGTGDFFLDVNRKFHERLLQKKMDHEYLEKPGGHTLEYWKDSYTKQILFFVKWLKR